MSAFRSLASKIRASYPGQPVRDGDPRLEAQTADMRARETRPAVSPLALLAGLPGRAAPRR